MSAAGSSSGRSASSDATSKRAPSSVHMGVSMSGTRRANTWTDTGTSSTSSSNPNPKKEQ